MNGRHETVIPGPYPEGVGTERSVATTKKMGMPGAARALAPRAGMPQGFASEADLNSTPQGKLVLSDST
jgi:hypothetical protein